MLRILCLEYKANIYDIKRMLVTLITGMQHRLRGCSELFS